MSILNKYNCLLCNNIFYRYPSRKNPKYCSRLCQTRSISRARVPSVKQMKALRRGNKAVLKYWEDDNNRRKISNKLKEYYTSHKKIVSEETKAKLSLANSGKVSNNKGKPMSVEQKYKLSKIHIEKWNKIGRKIYLRRPFHGSFLYREFTKLVFERDNYTCVLCGIRGGKLNADHYPKSFSAIVKEHSIKNMAQAMSCRELWDVNNGRTLCVDCHRKTETYGNRNRNNM